MEFVGSVTAQAAMFLNLTPNEAIWETPMSVVGWGIAYGLASKGVKGIGRQADVKALFDMNARMMGKK